MRQKEGRGCPAAPAAARDRRAAATPRPAPPPARTATTQSPAAAAPAPRYPNAATRARIDELLAKIEDAYFDYDKAALRPDALKALQADSTELRDILKDYPDYKLTVEGHCDERGSAEYNVALGDRRAEAAKDYLVQVGIPAAQLNVISYGKETPGLRGARRSLLAAEPPHPHRGHGAVSLAHDPNTARLLPILAATVMIAPVLTPRIARQVDRRQRHCRHNADRRRPWVPRKSRGIPGRTASIGPRADARRLAPQQPRR